MADRLRKTFADGVKNGKYLIIIVGVTQNIRHLGQFADILGHVKPNGGLAERGPPPPPSL
jgi:hypothetical protein